MLYLLPTGYADAITDGFFMLPDEQQMTFSEFVDILNKETDAVYYIQKQNSNLTTELRELYSQVDADISWATEAFGNWVFLAFFSSFFSNLKKL